MSLGLAQVLSKLCLRGHVDHAAAALLHIELRHSTDACSDGSPSAAGPCTPTQLSPSTSQHLDEPADPTVPDLLTASTAGAAAQATTSYVQPAAEASSQNTPQHSPTPENLPRGLLLAGLTRSVRHQAAAGRLLKALLVHCSTADGRQRAALQACVSQLWGWSLCR